MKLVWLSKNSKKAFTVVELIIIIVVIGVLASIGVASYAGTRNQADKSAYNATAQQVKLKLGEYYTDNNHYPIDKAAVTTYLAGVGAHSLRSDFDASQYVYGVWSSSAKGSCAANVRTCQYYEITVDKSAWRGSATDTNLVIVP